jgi:hypothetical protein
MITEPTAVDGRPSRSVVNTGEATAAPTEPADT